MELPIFDQNQAQIAKAQYAFEQAIKAFEAADLTLMHEVRGAWHQATTAWDVARFYTQRSVPLAQRNLELGLATFRAGQTSMLEVLELQRFLLETRQSHVTALQNAAQETAQLEQAIGLPFADILDRLERADELGEVDPAKAEAPVTDSSD